LDFEDQLSNLRWPLFKIHRLAYLLPLECIVHILQVITRVNRGGPRDGDNLINGLLSEKLECSLAAGFVETGANRRQGLSELFGIRVAHLGRSISLFDDLLRYSNCAGRIRRINPDLINTHTSKAGALTPTCHNWLGKQTASGRSYVSWSPYIWIFQSPKTRLVILIERFLSKYTDLFISSGTLVRNELVSAK
jgi:hypothetical protein